MSYTDIGRFFLIRSDSKVVLFQGALNVACVQENIDITNPCTIMLGLSVERSQLSCVPLLVAITEQNEEGTLKSMYCECINAKCKINTT